jgi:hypothetical protein
MPLVLREPSRPMGLLPWTNGLPTIRGEPLRVYAAPPYPGPRPGRLPTAAPQPGTPPMLSAQRGQRWGRMPR